MSLQAPSSRIPIRNIYCLLCYAWNRLEQKNWIDVSAGEVNELPDLIARVFLHGYRQLRRQALEQGYRGQEAEIAGVRGRIDLVTTHRRLLDRHGRAACTFDDLTPDTVQNRVVKAAAIRLSRLTPLSRKHREQVKVVEQELAFVTTCPLTQDLLRQIQLHNNNRQYAYLMDLARLILLSSTPDENTGNYRFMDFTRNKHHMARLFEDFIFNFLRVERPDASVSRDHINWAAISTEDPALSLLPTMRTDVTVRVPGSTLVIDAKYYEETFAAYYDTKKLHSAHLYQLLTYLTNMASMQGQDAHVKGMLIYPVANASIDVRYRIQGHDIRVRTLNLAQEWRQIHEELKSLF